MDGALQMKRFLKYNLFIIASLKFLKSNVKTTLYLFDYLYMLKKEFLLNEKEKLVKLLEKMPDFYFEMKWDFESSVIPLIGKLAPSGFALFFFNCIIFQTHLSFGNINLQLEWITRWLALKTLRRKKGIFL